VVVQQSLFTIWQWRHVQVVFIDAKTALKSLTTASNVQATDFKTSLYALAPQDIMMMAHQFHVYNAPLNAKPALEVPLPV
jgi:hypothetical protein